MYTKAYFVDVQCARCVFDACPIELCTSGIFPIGYIASKASVGFCLSAMYP